MEQHLVQWLDGRLGRCRRCMRKSFTAAAGTALATAGGWTWGSPLVAAILASAATGLLLLWMAHVAAFAWRKSAQLRHAAPSDAPDLGRRAVFTAFTRIFVGTAVATALPAVRARAEQCGQTTLVCKDPLPVCCFQPGRGYYCAKAAMWC
jgi:hypothetical protein